MKVFVGLSGGVDSAVSAALLQAAGHDVVGVFMKNWSGVTAGVECPWADDWASARQVAAHLGIPLKLYDFEDRYRATVGQYLIDTYRAGLTPNPDIMCNDEIKFKAFLDQCLDEGADMIATGHYARIRDGNQLLRGADPAKDQSYFLYRVPDEALARSLFPLGELTKTEVRRQARKLKLPNAARPDSQGICFVGPVPMKDFLHEFIDYAEGEIQDERGRVVGRHDGVFFYTIGQRHGLGVGGGAPYFVYDKDVAGNILRVTTDEQSPVLNKSTFTIDNCVWHEQPAADREYDIQVRYRSRPIAGHLKPAGNSRHEITLAKPERAIAPGQSAVAYDAERVIGGGIIT